MPTKSQQLVRIGDYYVNFIVEFGIVSRQDAEAQRVLLLSIIS
jgi:hypothetical protein